MTNTHAASWTARAACANANPDVFFPDKGRSPRQAKQICNQCPVQTKCLDEALKRREPFGVWGGLTEYDRRPLLRGKSA